MKDPWRASFGAALLLRMTLAVTLSGGCDMGARTSTFMPVGPTPPVAPRPPSNPHRLIASWVADYRVVAVSGCCPCGWGISVGQRGGGVLWSITIAGDVIEIYEDVANYPTDGIPYRGSLTGQAFSATYDEPARPAPPAPEGFCRFRGGATDGRFSADGKSFEATERLYWDRDIVVERRGQVQ